MVYAHIRAEAGFSVVGLEFSSLFLEENTKLWDLAGLLEYTLPGL